MPILRCISSAVFMMIIRGRTRSLIYAATIVGLSAASYAFPHTADAIGSFAHSRVNPPYAVCPAPMPGHAECPAISVPTVSAVSPDAVGPGYEGSGEDGGFSPTDLQSAYKLPETGGSGQTVAIIDAYDDPSAYTDLKKYREHYKLSECTEASGCFKKVNQSGETKNYPEASTEWSVEVSIDVDMVSAVCSSCHILLVEAKNNELSNLSVSDEEAVTLGATEVSDSWYGSEFEGETSYDKDLDHPGVPIVTIGGDNGYGVSWPGTSRYVISVGGTALKKESKNSRGWTEEVWKNAERKVGEKGAGTGSGCSTYETKPAWQHDAGCSHRTDNDVAAVASGSTPVSAYDSTNGGWGNYSGTSVSAPIVAAVEALSSSYSRSLGAEAFYIAGSEKSLFDVTTGSDGTCGTTYEYLCTAETGYDGPTGWGAPDGALKLEEGKWSVEESPDPSEATYTSISAISCTSSTECTADGWSENGAKVFTTLGERWNGTKWTIQSTPNPVGTTANILSGVSCVSSTSCLAVGYALSGTSWVTLAEKWNGTEWKSVAPVNPSGSKESLLYEVSCMSSTECTAIGTSENSSKTAVTLAERWNGTEWSLQSTPNPSEAKGSVLFGISCMSSSECVSTGNYKNSAGTAVPLAELWKKSEWQIQSIPNPSGAKEIYLYGVSCTSPEDCVVVGSYENSSAVEVPFSERWNGKEWSVQSALSPTGAKDSYLNSVSCVSFTACIASGFYVNSSGVRLALAERWNGKEWNIQSVPGPTGSKESELFSIRCLSSIQCFTGGDFLNSSSVRAGLIEGYN